ncbi:MAG: hypothetical protein BRC29_03075 [Nanohaloarchaea archaeon SW_7_43_1]|nr:MAG: hypothetical protein BRC29_03075 [Nanohaloarchaea archaeon SW_7_43_1]
MPDTPNKTRRKFLKGITAAGATLISGCDSPSRKNPNDNQTTKTDKSQTDTSTDSGGSKTEFLQINDQEDSVYSYNKKPQNQFDLDSSFQNRHRQEIDRVLDNYPTFSTWLESLDQEEKYTERLKSEPVGTVYPYRYTETGNGPNDYERFWFNKPEGQDFSINEVTEKQSFKSSQTLQEALNWLHPYMNRWQNDKLPERPIPEHSDRFAPLLQEGVQQHHDFEIDIFPIRMYEVKEGGTYAVEVAPRDEDNRYEAMIGIDRSNNDTLLIESNPSAEYDNDQAAFLSYKFVQPRAEPGAFDETQNPYEWGDVIHTKAENSIHLPEHAEIDSILEPQDGATSENGKKLYQEGIVDYNGDPLEPQIEEVNDNYWHPLRFNRQEPDVEGLDYSTASKLVGEMFLNTTRPQDVENPDFEGIAFTPDYLDSVKDTILNHKAFDYDQLKLESRAANTLEQSAEAGVVVSGRIGESYAVKADQNTVEDVWSDVKGEYNDIHENSS